MFTMLLGGFWHGASWKFVFWGAGHGLLLVLHKLWMKYIRVNGNSWYMRFAGWLFTFVCVALLWIPFRAISFTDALTIYQSIFSYSNPAVLIEIWLANTVLCVVFLLAMLTLLLPYRIKNTYAALYMKMPVLIKLLGLAMAIQASIQLTDSEVQPFIYFQF
jgi:D-alanyl-lipoteichoic acid acyltransferase DltB (MBOAT superfamily)